ncbi:unnamed protein product [Pleuronectes platessa]|uniref:Uncharacterized protein n=1 Tax=Pleuronectes platessa TaxID=8262 RepID=A0A9N7V3N4_PLEPL|nr:unnamed protein product [Pleuronectes platessa]
MKTCSSAQVCRQSTGPKAGATTSMKLQFDSLLSSRYLHAVRIHPSQDMKQQKKEPFGSPCALLDLGCVTEIQKVAGVTLPTANQRKSRKHRGPAASAPQTVSSPPTGKEKKKQRQKKEGSLFGREKSQQSALV